MAFMIFVCLLAVFAFYKYKSIDDFPKKWRKFKFESRMSWNGFSSSTVDLCYRSVDKVSLFPQPNKIAVMTGGNRGIGLDVLKKLLQCEMTVVCGVRNPDGCREIVEKSFDESLWNGKIFYEKCDTSDMGSVREFARKVQAKFTAVNLLINNAGILSAPYVITRDGFVSQMAVNYLGHFLLTHLLMPQLIAGSCEGEKSRIINVSSSVHSIGQIRYDDFDCRNYYRAGMAYADSKLAQTMFTKHVKSLCDDNSWKVQVHSVHPGMVGTDIFQKSFLGPLSKRPISCHWFKSTERGARSIIHASISPDLEDKTGTYIRNCRIWETSANANDPKECENLFKFTCGLLKIENFGSEEIKV